MDARTILEVWGDQCSQLLWLGFATGMLESGWGRREPSQPTVHRPVSESPSANVTLALTYTYHKR